MRRLLSIAVVVLAAAVVAARSGMQAPEPEGEKKPVSYTHLTLPTNREV